MIITCQHEWVKQCQLRYRSEPPTGYHFEDAHYPEPECRNGAETARLWYPDHIVHGALQTLNLLHPCMHGCRVHVEREILLTVYPEYAELYEEAYKFCQSFASAGCYWVTDGTTEIKLSKGELPPEGFNSGRLLSNRKWFTNGEQDLWLAKEEEIPEGYCEGRSRMSGRNNSQYGVQYQWITDGRINKKLWENSVLPDGWEFGQTASEKGTLNRKEAVKKLCSEKLPDGRSKHAVKAGTASASKRSIPIAVVAPGGEESEFPSVEHASKGTGLSGWFLKRICDGKIEHHKGWSARYLPKEK